MVKLLYISIFISGPEQRRSDSVYSYWIWIKYEVRRKRNDSVPTWMASFSYHSEENMH